MKKQALYLSLSLLFPFFSAVAEENGKWQPLKADPALAVSALSGNDDGTELQERGNSLSRLISSIGKSLKERNREVKALSPEETVSSAIRDMIEMSYPGGVEELKRRQSKAEDDLYNLIVSAPKYIYQYFAPFLHTLPYMPARILNIPGIKELKGKFPTRIAPQMKEYAKKHGKYMSPYLYILLMPEAFPSKDREKPVWKSYSKVITIDENTTPDDFFYINNKSLLDKHKMLSPEEYRSGKFASKAKRPQTPVDKVTEMSPVTQGDIEASLSAVKELKTEFGTNRLDEFHSLIRRMALFENNLHEELLNPFQVLMDRVERMPEKYRDKMRGVLAKHGFTPKTFGITMDKILKAHRVAKMTPATALNLAAWRGLKRPPESFDVFSPEDKAEAWRSIQLFLKMYSTSQENLLAVKKYSGNIRDALGIKDMTFMEAPIYGI